MRFLPRSQRTILSSEFVIGAVQSVTNVHLNKMQNLRSSIQRPFLCIREVICNVDDDIEYCICNTIFEEGALFESEFVGPTWIPETVKYGISKLTLIGGILPCCCSSARTEGRLNLHRNKNSLPPGKFLIFQTNASFSGTYAALPYKKAILGN